MFPVARECSTDGPGWILPDPSVESIVGFVEPGGELHRVSVRGCVHAWSGMDSAEWDEDGGRINKTLRFCRRCIDVVFILSSLMSTCELDRFVIQTPYIKVVKSCSAPFVDRGRGHGRTNGGGTNATRTDERTDGRGTLCLSSWSLRRLSLNRLTADGRRKDRWAEGRLSGSPRKNSRRRSSYRTFPNADHLAGVLAGAC